jgi:hypothetical protein
LTSYLLREYFSPTPEIRTIRDELQKKYSLQPEFTIVAFYRGNDKATEMQLFCPREFKLKAESIRETCGYRIWAQSDETSFLRMFEDALVFDDDDIRHCQRHASTVDRMTFKNSTQSYAKKFLAIVLLMSECAHVITNSGNCGMWICLFRGHAEGLHQRHASGWFETE